MHTDSYLLPINPKQTKVDKNKTDKDCSKNKAMNCNNKMHASNGNTNSTNIHQINSSSADFLTKANELITTIEENKHP